MPECSYIRECVTKFWTDPCTGLEDFILERGYTCKEETAEFHRSEIKNRFKID